MNDVVNMACGVCQTIIKPAEEPTKTVYISSAKAWMPDTNILTFMGGLNLWVCTQCLQTAVTDLVNKKDE